MRPHVDLHMYNYYQAPASRSVLVDVITSPSRRTTEFATGKTTQPRHDIIVEPSGTPQPCSRMLKFGPPFDGILPYGWVRASAYLQPRQFGSAVGGSAYLLT